MLRVAGSPTIFGGRACREPRLRTTFEGYRSESLRRTFTPRNVNSSNTERTSPTRCRGGHVYAQVASSGSRSRYARPPAMRMMHDFEFRKHLTFPPFGPYRPRTDCPYSNQVTFPWGHVPWGQISASSLTAQVLFSYGEGARRVSVDDERRLCRSRVRANQL
jgi:hypothetical protein